jgi:hypothetical protein
MDNDGPLTGAVGEDTRAALKQMQDCHRNDNLGGFNSIWHRCSVVCSMGAKERQTASSMTADPGGKLS